MDREDRQMTREEAQKILDVLMPGLKLPDPRTEANFNLERMKLAVESPVSDITGEELIKQVKINRRCYQEGYAQAEFDLKHKLFSEEDREEEIILAYRKLIKKYIKNEMG